MVKPIGDGANRYGPGKEWAIVAIAKTCEQHCRECTISFSKRLVLWRFLEKPLKSMLGDQIWVGEPPKVEGD